MNDKNSIGRQQQTVKLAIDCETNEFISAESLLKMPEEQFRFLRRAAMDARVERRRRGGNRVLFRCAICQKALYLSCFIKEKQNRWFVHDEKSGECPWHSANPLSPDQTKALIYRGQQEGLQHREIKNFLAYWLEKDPTVSQINLEKTTFSDVIKGEWRRPDVKCMYQGKQIVFEIQLSYTFLSDVIERDKFYQEAGIYIIWVFAEFDLKRAVVRDELFFNKRNLFLLDNAAKHKTVKDGYLVFNGFYQNHANAINDTLDGWKSKFVGLDDLIFPVEIFRPYFYDAHAQSQMNSEENYKKKGATTQVDSWQEDINDFLEVALRYYLSDYNDELRDELIVNIQGLCKNPKRTSEVAVLLDECFWGHHQTLPILLSIKFNKVIGYKLNSVYQIIEAALRVKQDGRRSFAIIYLMAYKVFKPNVSEDQRKWIANQAKTIKESWCTGEPTFDRDTKYDKIITLLFPELENEILKDFGLPRANSKTDLFL